MEYTEITIKIPKIRFESVGIFIMSLAVVISGFNLVHLLTTGTVWFLDLTAGLILFGFGTAGLLSRYAEYTRFNQDRIQRPEKPKPTDAWVTNQKPEKPKTSGHLQISAVSGKCLHCEPEPVDFKIIEFPKRKPEKHVDAVEEIMQDIKKQLSRV